MDAQTNPFEELNRYFKRMSRQFDDSSRMWGTEPFDRWMSEFGAMAIDLVEYDEEFVATVELPGFDRDEIGIEVTDHTLRIEADHETHTDTEEQTYLRKERRHESTHRSIQLPEEIDRENVTATMQNGVLTVTLPKHQTDDTRSIEIDVE